MPTYPLLCMGRSSIDLYSNDVGAPFPQIRSFAAYVGGSPTNIAVGFRRLGLASALLTAVGNDPVGDFILTFLRQEGVETRFIPIKEGRRSSAVVLGIEPPDRFPLVFYRDNCADVQLTIDDAAAAPLKDCGMFQFAGTNLAAEPCRSATLWAAEKARRAGARVILDCDFRPGQWHDPRAFGVAVRSALRLVDVVLATEDELHAVLLDDPAAVTLTDFQESDARVEGDTPTEIETLLGLGPEALVLKSGARGATLFTNAGACQQVAGFPVQVQNILGAGDAFAAGFLFGLASGWDWQRAIRLGNVCGAIVVTCHGCANFMPSLEQARRFAARFGLPDL